MTVRGLFDKGISILTEAGVDEASQDAYYLMEEICGIRRKDILLDGDSDVASEQEARYLEAINKRSRHIPCQYITGTAYFMGHAFSVNENVLIPRQDTEVLVEQVLSEAKANWRILDVCTGSGCIAISIKDALPEADVTAIDISNRALDVAQRNAVKILGEGKVSFLMSDLLTELDESDTFDLIVSNPPYVSNSEYAALAEEIKDNEPSLALIAGAEGMDIYNRLVPQARQHLVPGGRLMLEIGSCQGELISRLLEKCGFSDVRIIKDLQGLDRVAAGALGN